MSISFAEPERLKEIFDGENREEWQKTSYIIKKLDLKNDVVIADVGAGTGYFSNIFSQIAINGKVYPIDCEINMVNYMKDRFGHDDFHNVEVLQSQLDDPCLPRQVDLIFIANAYRFITDRSTFLNKLFQQTKPDARFVFVDFKGSNARVSPSMAVDEVKDAGFEIVDLDTKGCPDHYILTFSKV